MNRSFSSKLSHTVINVIFIIMSLLVVIPMIYILSISFSTSNDIVKYGYTIVPHTFDITAYKYLFQVPKQIITGYSVSIAVTILGTT